jgi:hypothetical protein
MAMLKTGQVGRAYERFSAGRHDNLVVPEAAMFAGTEIAKGCP